LPTNTSKAIGIGKLIVDTYSFLPRQSVISACYLHDVAREKSPAEQKNLAKQFKGKLDPIEQSIPGLWHAPAGAQLIIDHWGLDKNLPVPRAVAFHSTGKPSMDPLLQALMVADFSEPGRDFPEAETIRERIGDSPLISLVRCVLRRKIQYALSKEIPIHPRSVEAYNELCD